MVGIRVSIRVWPLIEQLDKHPTILVYEFAAVTESSVASGSGRPGARTCHRATVRAPLLHRKPRQKAGPYLSE
jgi:hypothetical protein